MFKITNTQVFTAWRGLQVVLLSVMLLGSWQARSEDLWDVYQLALQNDANYLAAKENYEASLINLDLAKSTLKPTVTGVGSFSRQRSSAFGDNRSGDNHETGIVLNYTLFNQPNRIQYSQAKLEVQNALLEFEFAKDGLTLRVAERYFNLLSAWDAKEVARRQKIAIERQMDLAKQRLEVGLGTRTDLFDARARYQKADADLIAADIQISNARQALIEIITMMPASISQLAEDSPLNPPEPNQIAHWIDRARTDNLLVQFRARSLEIANLEVDRQRAARSPVIGLEVSQRWFDNDFRSVNSSYQSSTVKVNLNMPLYAGGRAHLRTMQAGFRTNSAEQSLEEARRRATSSTTSAFLAITSGISQVTALAEAIVAGESALQAKEEGFRAGLTTNLDVLDAQRDLSESRTNYLRARYNYLLSILRLEEAVGDLGDEDIQAINDWLMHPAKTTDMQGG